MTLRCQHRRPRQRREPEPFGSFGWKGERRAAGVQTREAREGMRSHRVLPPVVMPAEFCSAGGSILLGRS
eukprot:scaffold13917_cov52-Phaeocystis_antarctica.AAC.2